MRTNFSGFVWSEEIERPLHTLLDIYKLQVEQYMTEIYTTSMTGLARYKLMKKVKVEAHVLCR